MKSKIATISILFLIFLLALAVRMDSAKYGELGEFDPFWNYKATNYLVENGWNSYKEWQDMDSWYGVKACASCEAGRNVSETSQVGLHLTTAFLYNFYNGDLYSFVILIPAVFGALTVFPMYVLVQQLSRSPKAGLIASFFYSITFSILIRNSAGWFKSEPLGLLLGITFASLVTYLILNRENKINIKLILTSVLTGLMLSFALSSWIGSAILVFPILIFGLIIPIFAKECKGMGQIIGMIGAFSLIPMIFFERVEGLFLPFSLALIIVGLYVYKSELFSRKVKIGIVVVAVAVVFLTVSSSDVGERYKTSLLPFFVSDDKLVNSVAEQQLPTLQQIVYLQGFYIFLAPIGIILYLVKKTPLEKIWMITLVVTLMYFGMSLIRLQMIFSVAMIIMSAIGLVMIFEELRKSKKDGKIKATAFAIVMIVSISPYMVMWLDMSDTPPSILNGASQYSKLTNEWLMAMDFISTLEPDAKIFAWWDYGYWISVLGERTTYMDNSTLFTHAIVNYAKIFAMPPEDAHKELVKIDADYVLVYSTTYKENGEYKFAVGGDELKSNWILALAEKPARLDNHFFTNTLLGGMIPFIIDENGQALMVGKNIENFELVYMSESYKLDEDGIRYGILIYKVLNK